MIIHEDILWCDTAVGQPLDLSNRGVHPSVGLYRQAIRQACTHFLGRESDATQIQLIGQHTEKEPWQIARAREQIALNLANDIVPEKSAQPQLAGVIEQAILSTYHHASAEYKRAYEPNGSYAGYAFEFERVYSFPPRMQAAAMRSDLTNAVRAKERLDRPWMGVVPRVVFIPDTDDMLMNQVDFEYVRNEVVNVVGSHFGRRHLWVWQSKHPVRLARFGAWLATQGVAWPDNLIPMTNVCSPKSIFRVDALRSVPARYRALSLEPMLENMAPDLTGIDWVIISGGTSIFVFSFPLEWIRSLSVLARAAGTAMFVAQLGHRPALNGEKLWLNDQTGRDWDEWPTEFRIRELPPAWHQMAKPKDPRSVAPTEAPPGPNPVGAADIPVPSCQFAE